MPPFDPEQLARVLVERGGYNPTDARNAAYNSGGRALDLAREFGLLGGGGGGGDVFGDARQVAALQRELNQPAISSYQAQLGEVSGRFAGERGRLEAERAPTEQRYQRIIQDIISRENLATTREFGKRGIPPSSGLYEQTVNERVLPAQERVGLEAASAQRELTNRIAGLTDQEIEQRRLIRNAIAQLESGSPGEAISQALSMARLNEGGEASEPAASITSVSAPRVSGRTGTTARGTTRAPSTVSQPSAARSQYLQATSSAAPTGVRTAPRQIPQAIFGPVNRFLSSPTVSSFVDRAQQGLISLQRRLGLAR